MKVDGALVDAYYFCVGGAVGRHQAVARPIGLRLPATAVAPAIERLLRAILGERRPARASASSPRVTPMTSCACSSPARLVEAVVARRRGREAAARSRRLRWAISPSSST